MNQDLVTLNLRVNPIIEKITPPSDELQFVGEGIVEEKNKLFEKLEAELNEAKDLSNADFVKIQAGDTELEKFRYEFREMSRIYGKPLRQKIARQFNGQHVTNAWVKFYEIAADFNWDQQIKQYFPDSKIVTAFHNAEFPGAGICAMNHFFLTRLPNYKYSWVASSLWPNSNGDFNNILSDAFQIYEKNKENWLMSPTGNNGDCTNVDNLIDFEEKVGKVKVYTSDAGIDVSDDFDAQEIKTIFIHLGCALAGFMTLDVGGMMLLKQYTRFHELSWSLIVLYSTLFDNFYLTKPTSSKNTGSEVYLVGTGFKGLPTNIRDLLLEKLRTKSLTPVFHMNDLNREFYAKTYENIRNFTVAMNELQINYLRLSYDFIEKFKQDDHAKQMYYAKMNKIRNEYTEEWIQKYKMKRLNKGHIKSSFKSRQRYRR